MDFDGRIDWGVGDGRNRIGYLWRLSVTLCLKPVGGLTCHSTSSFWSLLQAILLRFWTPNPIKIKNWKEHKKREKKESKREREREREIRLREVCMLGLAYLASGSWGTGHDFFLVCALRWCKSSFSQFNEENNRDRERKKERERVNK